MDLAVIAEITSTVGWIGWIIIGGLAGWLAGLIMRGSGFGILGDIIVGIIGGLSVASSSVSWSPRRSDSGAPS